MIIIQTWIEVSVYLLAKLYKLLYNNGTTERDCKLGSDGYLNIHDDDSIDKSQKDNQ